MKIAIIDYKAGNIRSVIFALERLGVQPILTADIETILSADKVIFPGQGEASSAMRNLRERGLDKLIPNLKQPFLGVCVCMQLLCDYSEENDTPCLGVIPQRVLKFPTHTPSFIPLRVLDQKMLENRLKVPQVGWNKISISDERWVIGDGEPSILSPKLNDQWFYFVHSYYVEKGEYTTATAEYGVEFSACLKKDNFHAAQFHPEKSSTHGEQLIQNFLEKC